MKTLKKITTLTTAALLTIGLTLNFTGCSKESSLGPEKIMDENSAKSLSKRPVKTTADAVVITGDYPQTSSGLCRYQKNYKQYLGVQFKLNNGSQFYLNNYALTPPDAEIGQNVTITMTMDKNDQGEYITDFGPHGSTFDPPAKVILNWSKMEIPEGQMPTLSYIDDDGVYIEQQPDQIDLKNKWFILYIPHFSRYALAHSE